MNVDSFFKKISLLPNWINWIALRVNFFGSFLYGRSYAKKTCELGRQFHRDPAFISLINRFIKNTPYYSAQYVELESLTDFQKNIKIIDKNVVLNNFDKFVSNKIKGGGYVEGTTGGTTGKPMRIVVPANRYGFELAVVHNYWKKHGWFYHPRGVLRNHKLPLNVKYRINPVTKEIVFDAFRQDDEYIRYVYNLLRNKRIKFIQAYPSSAYQFCKRCKELGLKLDFIVAFLTSSEPVHPYQRVFISDELGIKLFNFYGHSEKLIIAENCIGTDYYHFEPSYGFAELLDENDQPVTQPGQWGNLVGTTFNNPSMPLLRFKTGDSAEYIGDACPKCGVRALVVKNIIGHRDQNLIFKKIGYTTTTALNLHSDLYLAIDGLQYLQEKVGQLVVNIKPNAGFTEEVRDRFLQHFKHAMGSDSEIELRFVDGFHPLPNGKFPLLISRVMHGRKS